MKYADESQIRTLANSGRITHPEAAAARSELRGDTIVPREESHPRVDLRKPRRWVKMFQAQFVPKVQDGTKTTTIRPSSPGGNPQPGDTLDARMWTGKPYRSKQASILTAKITKVRLVRVDEYCIRFAELAEKSDVAWAEGYGVGNPRLNEIAKADGFSGWRELAAWFQSTHGLPFTGVMIEWEVAS